MFKWRPSLAALNVEPSERIRIDIIGIPSRMRTVRSLLRILAKFPGMVEEVVVIHAPGIEDDIPLFDPGQREELLKAGLSLRCATNLRAELPELMWFISTQLHGLEIVMRCMVEGSV